MMRMIAALVHSHRTLLTVSKKNPASLPRLKKVPWLSPPPNHHKMFFEDGSFVGHHDDYLEKHRKQYTQDLATAESTVKSKSFINSSRCKSSIKLFRTPGSYINLKRIELHLALKS
jgi:hypothetical protein